MARQVVHMLLTLMRKSGATDRDLLGDASKIIARHHVLIEFPHEITKVKSLSVKQSGLHLNFFIVEQIPTLPPDAYDGKCPWAKSKKLEDWIADRVLKLTCTADDMRPLAEAAGFAPGVWKWRDDERAQLRAELDAAYFHLYQLSREDVEYILGTFQGIAKEDERADGAGATRSMILETYDGMVR